MKRQSPALKELLSSEKPEIQTQFLLSNSMSGYIQSDMGVKRRAACLGEAEKILRENTWGSEA